MKVFETRLPGVLILEPRMFHDSRGFFAETYQRARYAEYGIPEEFVQDNISVSSRGVLRGLHFQNPTPQGKLVGVLQGSAYDVVVDVRKGSGTFGQWIGVELTGEPVRQLWIPAGFAHGFVTTAEATVFSYKCTAYYEPRHERAILWNDPELAIEWPILEPVVSQKDRTAPRLRDFPDDHLLFTGPC